MLMLEITNVQPMDVLVTSGKYLSSKVNQALQTAVRGRMAAFSHSALFLSPALVLESTTDNYGTEQQEIEINKPKNQEKGIALKDLVSPAASDKSVVTVQTNSPIEFYPRMEDGCLRIFVHLDNVTKASVFRHSSLVGEKNLWSFRQRALTALSPYYLLQYPPSEKLLNVAPFVSERFADAAGAFTDWFHLDTLNKKGATGPFCSELVAMAFIASKGLLPLSINTPRKVAPSDFADLNEFIKKPIVRAFDCHSPTDLPGKACENGFSHELRTMLSTNLLRQQSFEGKLIQIRKMVDDLAEKSPEKFLRRSPGSFLTVEEIYSVTLLSQIESFLTKIADEFWLWLREANCCLKSCPKRRHEAGHVIDPIPLTFTEQNSLPTYKRRVSWSGNRCSDLRGCRCASTNWLALCRH
jgi:hypothetical protein